MPIVKLLCMAMRVFYDSYVLVVTRGISTLTR